MAIKKISDLVREHVFFQEMDSRVQELVSGCGCNKVYEADQWLAKEGDPANQFLVIREGRAAIEIHVPGRGNIPLQTIQEGEVVGWSWLFPPHEWTFGVRAVTEVHAIQFDGECLRKKCEQDPVVGYALMKSFAGVMAKRLRNTRLRLLDVYRSEVSGG